MTRWSLVARAGAPAECAASSALNELLEVYRPLLKKHLVCNMNFTPHSADDCVQNFVAQKIMGGNVLAGVRGTKGRFRVYLLKVFSNFTISEIRKQKARKRAPLNEEAVRLDDSSVGEMADQHVQRAFDQEWAKQIVALAVDRMRRECDEKGRHDLWDIFLCRVLDPALDQVAPPSYDTLIKRFGIQSPSQASNLLITAKRMFRRSLEAVVRETVVTESQVEDEIRELKAILAG